MAILPAGPQQELPASSGPRVDHPQFSYAISISSFYPQILCNVTSSFKSTKKSKSKPALHGLSYIGTGFLFLFSLKYRRQF